MCRIEDCDASEVYQARHVKAARKAHRCNECGREIQIGEPYRYSFGISYGGASEDHICAHCCVGLQWLLTNCGGYVLGEVAEEIEEHAVEYPELSEPLMEMARAMHGRWTNKDGSLVPVMAAPPDTPAIVEYAAKRAAAAQAHGVAP